MRVAKDNVDVRMEIPGAVIRQRTDFGDVSGFDKISGEYFTLSAGVDTTPLFLGLEGDLCQCAHWGFVLRGRITTTDAKGAQETVNANDLFYWPPGHNVKVDADAEIVMFSPQREHGQAIDAEQYAHVGMRPDRRIVQRLVEIHQLDDAQIIERADYRHQHRKHHQPQIAAQRGLQHGKRQNPPWAECRPWTPSTAAS